MSRRAAAPFHLTLRCDGRSWRYTFRPHGLRRAVRADVDVVSADRPSLDAHLARQRPGARLTRSGLGRPLLSDPRFDDLSRAHCPDRTVLALGRGCRLGVDIERADRLVGARVARWLHPDLGLGQAQSLALWTANEAHAKATGTGLLRHTIGRAVHPPLSRARTRALQGASLRLFQVRGWIFLLLRLPAHVLALALRPLNRPIRSGTPSCL